MLTLFPAHALADEPGCCGGEDHYREGFGTASDEIWWDREEIVYLANEADIWKYEREPNVKYTFIVENQSPTRAMCSECGLGTVTTRSVTNQTRE